ncbi:hypothetical protein OTU49_001063, partial [Cherax quadricarinatus]
HAYNLLEREYLPLFMHSHAYFAHLCGTRSSQGYQKNATNSPGISRHRRTDSSSSATFSPFKSRISKAQADEVSGMSQSVSSLEGLTSSFRDLSAWRVSIPCVEQRLDHV